MTRRLSVGQLQDLARRLPGETFDLDPPEPEPWRLRVTEHALVDPGDLLAHPSNWHAHPDQQRQAFVGVARELGFVGEVLVSKRSGRILDGHMRVAEALAAGQWQIPVGYVDCADDDEEERILATFDPIGALARSDEAKLARLAGRQSFQDAALRAMLTALVPATRGSAPPHDGSPESGDPSRRPGSGVTAYAVIVECDSESAQQALLDQLHEEGWNARPVSR